MCDSKNWNFSVDEENTALLSELMLQAEVFCASIEEAILRLPTANDVDELRMKISQCRGALAVLQRFYEKDLLTVENAMVSGTFRQLIMSLLWVSFQAGGVVDRGLFRKLVQIESGFTYLLLAAQSRKT